MKSHGDVAVHHFSCTWADIFMHNYLLEEINVCLTNFIYILSALVPQMVRHFSNVPFRKSMHVLKFITNCGIVICHLVNDVKTSGTLWRIHSIKITSSFNATNLKSVLHGAAVSARTASHEVLSSTGLTKITIFSI